MNNLIICGVKEAENFLEKEQEGFFNVVSIASGQQTCGTTEKRPFHLFKAKKVLRLFFDDSLGTSKEESFGLISPEVKDIKKLIAFTRLIKFGTQEQNRTCIVHCQAGISRSSACAFVMNCFSMGDGNEVAALDNVFRAGIGQEMSLNQLIVTIGDKLLNRNGKMTKLV